MKGKTIAIIPARGGSKGLKDKNIKEVGGIPLICHTLNQLHQCKRIDRILLSTDSPTKIKGRIDLENGLQNELLPSKILSKLTGDIPKPEHLKKRGS